MKLTSKGRYAVTAVLDIALNAEIGPVSLSDISDRQHISLPYLEQLFAQLRRCGLVQSFRGPGGGYQLSMPIESISVGMIIAAVNEHVYVTKCTGQGDCQNGRECLTHSLWSQLSRQIEEFLGRITVAELVNKHKSRHMQHSIVCNRQQYQDIDNLIMLSK